MVANMVIDLERDVVAGFCPTDRLVVDLDPPRDGVRWTRLEDPR